MKRILNFGSLNIDHVYSVEHFVRPGETMRCRGMEVFCGGKGLNQSVALAKAGAAVWHAGAVGNDDGKKLLETLTASGVDVSFVRQTKGGSGHTIIQVDKDGQNCILLYGGANQEITRDQVEETLSHFAQGDILLLQNEINELPYLMEAAKHRGMEVFLNPSPVTEELLKMPLEMIDCFILNEIEAADLCGKEAVQEEFPELLHEKYPNSSVLLTLGSQGSIYYDGKKRFVQPAYHVNAVDTTAAGDTFTGYFIALSAGDARVQEALWMASKAAAIAVTKKGASVSIPEKAVVEALS